jgi:hypothetical protein
MFTNTQLRCFHNPVAVAYQCQEKVEKLKADLAAAEIEYNQVINHCRNNKVLEFEGFAIFVKPMPRRMIIPKTFARLFPEENKILVDKEVAFITTELNKIKETQVLLSIRIEDVKGMVADDILTQACVVAMNEKVTVRKAGEQE